MTVSEEIEHLRSVTKLQTDLVLQEARLAEEAIGHGRIVAAVEYDEDDPNAFHVSRGRPTAIILPFARGTRR
jgi:hypothetical protein